jgi:hypothetical protein
LKAKTNHRRRRTKLIVKRLEAKHKGFNIRIKTRLKAKLEVRLKAKSSIIALNKFEGCIKYNDNVDKFTSYIEEPFNSL